MPNALILIDFENEWIDPDSDYFVGGIKGVIERTNRLIDYCRKKNYKIIFTRHIELESDGAFKMGSKNVEIIPAVQRKESDTVITKNKISPFYRTNMEKELNGIEKVVVCGILANLCVRSFIEEAYDRDFEITVIKDCCVAFGRNTQEFTFKDLKATREEVEFINLKDFLL
jgi:nicotinamidase-related amidase